MFAKAHGTKARLPSTHNKRHVRKNRKPIDPSPVPKSQIFTCTVEDCIKTFPAKKRLTAHISQCHPVGDPFQCPDENCKHTTRQYKHLIQHILKHPKQYWECAYESCTTEYTYPPSLLGHLLKHPDEGPFRCIFNYCKEEILQRKDIIAHLKVHIQEIRREVVDKLNQDEQGVFELLASKLPRTSSSKPPPEAPFPCYCGRGYKTKNILQGHLHKKHEQHWLSILWNPSASAINIKAGEHYIKVCEYDYRYTRWLESRGYMSQICRDL